MCIMCMKARHLHIQKKSQFHNLSIRREKHTRTVKMKEIFYEMVLSLSFLVTFCQNKKKITVYMEKNTIVEFVH